MNNQVNKLRIISLKDPTERVGPLQEGTKAVVDGPQTPLVFEVQINPEQLARSLKIKNNNPSEHGTTAADLQFQKREPETLEIKFTLDGTGTVQNNGGVMAGLTNLIPDVAYVPTRLKQLEAVVYNFVDETHRPPFLVINWGTLVFNGVMEELAYTYNLFHPSGVPLRVEVTLKVKENKPTSETLAQLSLLSPDLTRRRPVRQSDTLLTICQDVYQNEGYYLEVAKANQLTNFRQKPLRNAVTDLLLPPIDKTQNR